VLRDTWLEKEPSKEVAVYLVWSSQLGAQERHVAEAAKLLPDPRVRHFWDGEQVVGTTFERVLGVGEPAWDVWMLFDRQATWEAGAPVPAWWEHQLPGMPEDRVLDGDRFSTKASALLKR
jgi:hypothetical protein